MYHDGDLDGEGHMLGHRGNSSHESDVPPASASSNYPRYAAPTELYAPQSTPALGNYHDDHGNVIGTHQPPLVTVPSHHPPPMRQMYAPSTFDDYQGNHAASMNLPIPSNCSHSMHTRQPTLGNFPPLPVPSGLDDPGAQVSTFTPLPTFRESHQGYYLPLSISSALHPGATAPMWAPPPLTPDSYQGNWPPSCSSDLHPGAMMQMHVPPPTRNDSDLPLPPVIVPSQNRPGDLALPLPPALADYWCKFLPPRVLTDGISTQPPVAPDDVQLVMPTLVPRSNVSERSRKRDGMWRFIECSGQRSKMFKAPPDTTRCTSSIDLPLLEYQCDLSIHEAFVVAAEKRLINEAVNNCTMMTLSERENLIQVALADAVKECLEKAQAIRSDSAKSVKEEIKDFGERWAAKNAKSLDMRLSAPFEFIIVAAEELASIIIDRGYDLRPSLWSNTSESKVKLTMIKALIHDAAWPLRFIFKKDEKTGQWMAFEHDAVLDVVLGVVRKLKYRNYVDNLDNLYCTAAAAIYCILMRYSSGKSDSTVKFTAKDFKYMYDMLKNHITDIIEKDENLAKRWLDVKAYTIVRMIRTIKAASTGSLNTHVLGMDESDSGPGRTMMIRKWGRTDIISMCLKVGNIVYFHFISRFSPELLDNYYFIDHLHHSVQTRDLDNYHFVDHLHHRVQTRDLNSWTITTSLIISITVQTRDLMAQTLFSSSIGTRKRTGDYMATKRQRNFLHSVTSPTTPANSPGTSSANHRVNSAFATTRRGLARLSVGTQATLRKLRDSCMVVTDRRASQKSPNILNGDRACSVAAASTQAINKELHQLEGYEVDRSLDDHHGFLGYTVAAARQNADSDSFGYSRRAVSLKP
ncbi:hypothetical protein BD769DRAFT_1382915 [Suillus cothurnatus]|nr:hypothetical protein BD769DRAFT_1382915 [Suillus cothurnatus]